MELSLSQSPDTQHLTLTREHHLLKLRNAIISVKLYIARAHGLFYYKIIGLELGAFLLCSTFRCAYGVKALLSPVTNACQSRAPVKEGTGQTTHICGITILPINAFLTPNKQWFSLFISTAICVLVSYDIKKFSFD